jgi:hypothetical protein
LLGGLPGHLLHCLLGGLLGHLLHCLLGGFLGGSLGLAWFGRLFGADQAISFGPASYPVGLRVDDARGMRLDADPQLLAQTERLRIGQPELASEFIDADFGWHVLLSPLVVS